MQRTRSRLQPHLTLSSWHPCSGVPSMATASADSCSMGSCKRETCQETMMARGLGRQSSHLHCAFAMMFAFCMSLAKDESLWNVAPLRKYVAILVSIVYTSSCRYEALEHVASALAWTDKVCHFGKSVQRCG